MRHHQHFHSPLERSPVEDASFLSQLLFSWINPIIKLGSVRPLEESDFFPLPTPLRSAGILAEIKSAWQIETNLHGKKASFGRTVYNAYGTLYISATLCMFVYMLVSVVQPYFVSALLHYVTFGEVNFIAIKSGIGIALLLGSISVVATITMNYTFYKMSEIAVLCRSASILIIFDKSLRLSSSAKSKHTTGEIVTLMSVDSERFVSASVTVSWLFWGPIVIIIAMCLLIAEVQYCALAGAGSMFLITFLQDHVSKLSGQTRRNMLKFTDERVKLVNETLQGIRVVKLYAWEGPTLRRIEEIRKQEMLAIAKFQYLKLINSVSMFLAPMVVSFAVFVSYAATGGKLTIEKVYTVYAILNIVRMPLAVMPMGLAALQDLRVSVRRMTQFLLLDEIEEQQVENGQEKPSHECVDTSCAEDVNVDRISPVSHLVSESCASESIPLSVSMSVDPRKVLSEIRNGSFSWTSTADDKDTASTAVAGKQSSSVKSETLTASHASSTVESLVAIPPTTTTMTESSGGGLVDVNLEIREGEFVAVVGSVGSGKSTLLSALLGHMRLVSGRRVLQAKVSYVCQEHWIQNRTLRENVLFDSPLDEDRYAAVLDASELSKDVLSLPHADETEIGEKGINLSGGQKARVSVARALYASDSDLFLFDDPLAAVDAHVGRAIFENAFCSMLRGKARLVVLSSNYHLLPAFDKVVVVSNGRVVACAPYSTVVESFPQYRSMEHGSNSSSCVNLAALAAKDEEKETETKEDVIPRGGVEREEFRNKEITGVVKPVSREEDETGEDERVPPMLAHTNQISNKSYKYSDNLAKMVSIRDMALSSKNLMAAEDREKGAVTSSTYFKYFTGAVSSDLGAEKEWIGVVIVVATLAVFSLVQAIRILADFWVGFWAKDTNRLSPKESFSFYLYGYIIIVTVCCITGVLRSFLFVSFAIASSRNVHNSALVRVLQAPINLYFDVTPLGRILNRFSKDLDSMDSMLPDTLLQNVQNVLYVLCILLLCIASSYFFAILMVPMAIIFYRVQNYYRKSSREMKRLESISRSPMYSLFEEVLQGLSTIRAYGRQIDMLTRHCERTDTNGKCFFVIWVASRWLALRLDLLCSLVIVAVALFGVISTDLGVAIDPNLLGLALVYSIQLTGLLQWTVRMIVETENSMTSVERLLAFTNVPSEAPSILPSDPLPDEWPTLGALRISNLSMSYRPGLEKVLNGVYVDIPPGCKVGVCGRTGAGKSSLMLALFRIVEPDDSSILVLDGVDLLSLGLHSLRSGLTIIPQDPVMFSGTLRYNLDPFSAFSDEEIWSALDRAQLRREVSEKFPLKLQHVLSERGENISVGQRQLLCIARALLRKSKVIVLDEATASVDTQTDEKIQQAVRVAFRDCTVLTIAHRLETIADSDLILVMEDGRIAERGTPLALLEIPNGLFRGLVDELGPERRDSLQMSSNR